MGGILRLRVVDELVIWTTFFFFFGVLVIQNIYAVAVCVLR